MKALKFLVFTLALTVFLPVLSFGDETMKQSSSSASATSSEATSIKDSSISFAFKSYQVLHKAGSENLIFSPLSAHVVVAALASGAKGETRKALHSALGFKGELVESGLYSDLLKAVTAVRVVEGEGKPFELSVLNALWLQKDYPINERFSALIKKDFAAQIESVDFTQSKVSAGQINGWVDKNSAGKIKDLISPEMISSLTRLILTNVVYFKSQWWREFAVDLTKEEPFYGIDGEKRTVQLMEQGGEFGYYEDESVQVLDLPYRDELVSMMIVLPRKGKELKEFEKTVSLDSYQRWNRELKYSSVDLFLPRFNFSWKDSLKPLFEKLGAGVIFNLNLADFSGISEHEELAVSDLIQQAFVSVDEKGTEAGAATAMMVVGSAYDPEPPKIFRADRPFLFIIRHAKTGVILFMGRVVKP